MTGTLNRLAAPLALSLTLSMGLAAQERRARIDVDHYAITAELNPRTQSVAATAQVRFTPQDNTSAVTFELNNALSVSKVTDAAGQQLSASRDPQTHTVRVNFPSALAKGTPVTVSISYDGKMTGAEESPVYGIKFAALREDGGYLMYPSRWFPINDYTVDRYTAELNLTVPDGYKVLAGTMLGNGSGTSYKFHVTRPGFPGSLALVRTADAPVRVTSEGVTSDVYFRTAKDAAQAWGTETGKVLAYLGSVYGLPPSTSLQLVETEAGTPNGYSAPGLLFLSPRVLQKEPSQRVLANQLSRQWWGNLVSPASRNHLWLVNGNAKYAESLYLEHVGGSGALETEMKDVMVDALTVQDAPLIQAARFEDYSPEYWATTGSKGAAVMHMLRTIMGDKPLNDALIKFIAANANKSVTTADFRKAMEAASNQNLQGFFVQWIESTGAPEFKTEYTVFRTAKGFRVLGKISQDLDTFRMPVTLRIETDGNPETKVVEVVGTSSEFSVDVFGKPRKVILDPDNRVLRFSNQVRVAVAIRRGEQLADTGEYTEALKEYQKALDVQRTSSLAHYRVAEVFFLQNNYQSAANEFREALSGDLDPKWTEVWSRINLGKIFDITGQRERARNEFEQALRTKDNTQGAQTEASKYINKPYERAASNI